MMSCTLLPTTPQALTLLALLFTGCVGATEIDLDVDRESISAGGIDHAVITARPYLSGDAVGAGTEVDFETTAGSFDQSQSVTSTKSSTNSDGEASVRLYSGPSEGSATLTATFYDAKSGATATSSITIKFTTATGSKSPVDGTFRLTCDAVNIGALREPIPDLQVTCKLAAQTRTGETIPASALNATFYTEAGSITTKTDAYTGEQVFIYSPKGGASAPRDVPPEVLLAEPSHNDSNGKQRNPRDGLATIVAVVEGEEAFNDLNGNGTYDPGEPFTDAAEPFVDTDDDDEWDPDEKYIDVNNNSRWDKANGTYDARTKIMAMYKILWTGKLDNSAQTSHIANGGKLELTAYALDLNMNPVAAFQANQDYLEWSLTSGGDATSSDSTSPPMDNSLGFSFDKAASTERKRWRILANSFVPPGHKFTVEDSYSTETDPATSFSVTARAYVTPGPGADGYYLSQITEVITDKVEGTCD